MASKLVFAFCAQVFLVQVALSQFRPSYGSNSINGNSVIDTTVIIDNSDSGVDYGLGLSRGYGGYGMGNGLNWANGLGGANVAGAGLIGAGWGSGLINNGLVGNNGLGNAGYISLAPVAAGGVLPVSSYSPIVPAGLNVVSDNAIEGALLVTGELPFLSAVAFEGALSSGGAGAAACGCGNGEIGILSETKGPVAGISNFGYGRAGLLY